MFADVAMDTVGEVERQRAFGQVVDIAAWRVDKNTVRKKVDIQLVAVDFPARAQARGDFLEIGDPLQVRR